jgi:hypothetical protein
MSIFTRYENMQDVAQQATALQQQPCSNSLAATALQQQPCSNSLAATAMQQQPCSNSLTAAAACDKVNARALLRGYTEEICI